MPGPVLKPRVASGPGQQSASRTGSHPGTAGSTGVSFEVRQAQPRNLAGPPWRGLWNLPGHPSTCPQSCWALFFVSTRGSHKRIQRKINRNDEIEHSRLTVPRLIQQTGGWREGSLCRPLWGWEAVSGAPHHLHTLEVGDGRTHHSEPHSEFTGGSPRLAGPYSPAKARCWEP